MTEVLHPQDQKTVCDRNVSVLRRFPQEVVGLYIVFFCSLCI